MTDIGLLNDLLMQAIGDGVLECPKCGCLLEPDSYKCGECGWKNPLITEGII